MNHETSPRFGQGTAHSPTNGAILAYLKTCGPASAADIGRALRQVSGWHDDAAGTRLKRALHKLAQRHLVHRRPGADSQVRWADGAPPAPAGAASQAKGAPPPQYDVMHAPVWRPGRGPALRPGALDAKALPSHGLRC